MASISVVSCIMRNVATANLIWSSWIGTRGIGTLSLSLTPCDRGAESGVEAFVILDQQRRCGYGCCLADGERGEGVGMVVNVFGFWKLIIMESGAQHTMVVDTRQFEKA